MDHFTQSSVKGIYAAGDVAVTINPITGDPIMTGLWINAVEKGRCAGLNMAGCFTTYAGTFGILNTTQVANEPFVSVGIVHTTGKDYETHVVSTQRSYRKLVFTSDESRLMGVVFGG